MTIIEVIGHVFMIKGHFSPLKTNNSAQLRTAITNYPSHEFGFVVRSCRLLFQALETRTYQIKRTGKIY